MEPVESSSLWDLYLCHESLCKILKNNTVTSSEESKNVFDEMLLVIVEIVPVFKVLTKIDFLSSPEACLLILVTLPDIIVLDWQDDESVWVILEKWLFLDLLSETLSLSNLLSRNWSILSSSIDWNLALDSTSLAVMLVYEALGELVDNVNWVVLSFVVRILTSLL